MNNNKTNAVDDIRHAINIIQKQSQSINAGEALAVLSLLNSTSQNIIDLSKKLSTPKPEIKTKTIHVPTTTKTKKPEIEKPKPVKPPTVPPHHKPVSKNPIKPIKPLKNKQPV